MLNKDDVIKRVQKKDDRVLVSNIIDKYNKYDKTGISTYSNFLDMRQLKVIESFLNHYKIEYNVYKANEECEKNIIYFGEYDNYVTIYKFKNNKFLHKDILGTLFSLGYDISTIGDIFVNEDYVYFTNLTRLNSFIETSLYYINNKKVNLEITDEIILSPNRFITLQIILPSYRLDNFVSKLAHMSRNDSNTYIKDGMVLLNYEETYNPSKIVNIGDVISIRKVGKFIVSNEVLVSKKNNYLIEIKKYN